MAFVVCLELVEGPWLSGASLLPALLPAVSPMCHLCNGCCVCTEHVQAPAYEEVSKTLPRQVFLSSLKSDNTATVRERFQKKSQRVKK